MIPAPFDYVRATSVDEALALLAEHGEDAKLIADVSRNIGEPMVGRTMEEIPADQLLHTRGW